MTRKLLFQIHWLLGITAGLVLAVMGVTGAMMSFQDELLAAFNPQVLTVPVATSPPLAPSALMAAASAARQGRPVAVLVLESAPDRAAQVEFAPADARQHHGERSYINPYTGQLLGLPKGAAFFLAVRNLHRYLLLPGNAGGIGRPVTGLSTLALIFFALSGLYLRWPRKPLDWRNWLTLDLRRRGRDLYRQLHAVIGVWLLLLYLLSAMTGLWWSFEFYRSGLTRMLASTASSPQAGAHPVRSGGTGRHAGFRIEPAALDAGWQQFRRDVGRDFVRASLMLPRDRRSPLVIRSLPRQARYGRMTDDWRYAADDGRGLGVQRYRDLPAGDLILGHILPLHDGSFFGLPGRVLLLLSSLTMPLFTVTGLLLYLGRRRQKRRLRAVILSAPPEEATVEGPLIIYASQAGHAERLARLTAQAFQAQGCLPTLLALNNWLPQQVREGQLCLFVVSTYGEGEPPDQGRLFARAQLARPLAPTLPAMEFAVLALGDRLYPDFCAFGRQLDAWLERGGARRAFPMLALDGDSPEGLRRWQRQLRRWGAASPDQDAWDEAAWQGWRLVSRQHLNPGSPGHPAYSLQLAPPAGQAAHWVAGDLVEILPAAAVLRSQGWPSARASESAGAAGTAATSSPRPREYSIASIDTDGRIQLLVRQVRHPDGRPGLCSGWLTDLLAIGDELPLRIRANPGFHPPPDARPLILIGSGTGLAGLLAHLRARAALERGANWLLFGERHAGSDDFFGAELAQALAQGRLQRLDRAYSRSGGGPRYVQDLLIAEAQRLQQWVGEGASIYVCGSLQGMAGDVDRVLREILGSAGLDAMSLAGRYRRDVY